MVKRAQARRRPRKAKPGTKGLTPGESRLEEVEGPAADALAAVEKAGGSVVGMYKEPLGGHPMLLAVLPIDAIEPTPFQRDLSDTHHKRLADVIAKTGRYLDPVIAVVAPSQGFWTPNGRHRLAAMRRLGATFITALPIPDESRNVLSCRRRTGPQGRTQGIGRTDEKVCKVETTLSKNGRHDSWSDASIRPRRLRSDRNDDSAKPAFSCSR